MEFSSVQFIAFLLISFAFYNFVKPTYKWVILLLASSVFIYSFSLKFLIFTIAFGIVNFGLGILIHRSQAYKNIFYQAGILLNIGILVSYKYTSFLLDNFFSLLGAENSFSDTKLLNLIIPIGISFYTFQSIGYLIDMKRGTKQAENNPGKFLLFIMYFPKFISGPVERTGNLLPQLNTPATWDYTLFKEGMLQMLWGYFKTIVISDRLAVMVTAVNGDLHNYSGLILFANFFIQFLYLYFNFSGYTDMVLGISKLFGIKLLGNFNRPLFAASVSEYWKRWHMSLTNWCNDYIFKRIILKRMKWKLWASVYGTFLTFLIIGIWHGASWNFVFLGILQGLAINYEFFTKKTRLPIGKKMSKGLNLSLSRFFTFVFICFSHVLFFTKNLNDAAYYFSHMFANFDLVPFSKIGLTIKDMTIVLCGVLVVYYSEYRDESGKKSVRERILNNPTLFWAVTVASIAIILTTGGAKGAGFIYEQF
jgi:alginate O-acetyltransferase complex protein AlgI